MSVEPNISIEFPTLPPSENAIRVIRVIRGKVAGMAYTKKASLYKKEFKQFIKDNYLVEIQKLLKTHTHYSVYRVQVELFFTRDQLVNKGWPKTKTFYKKMDVGNRRKLLEDCLAEVLGADDSLTFDLRMIKRCGTPGLSIDITQLDSAEEYGIPIKK